MLEYYILEKRKNKLYGIAVWRPADGARCCQAVANGVFDHYGLNGRVSHGQVTTRKNWAGLVEGAPVFTDTEKQADYYSELRRAHDYKRMGAPWDEYKSDQLPETVTQEQYESNLFGLK